MKDDYTTNSRYPTYTFLQKVGRIFFELRSERVKPELVTGSVPVVVMITTRTIILVSRGKTSNYSYYE